MYQGGYTREEVTGGLVTLRKEHPQVFSREAILQEIFSCNVPKLLYWELCDKLFKTELVTKIRFDESIANMEDMLFFWQVMARAKSFAYAPLFQYHYRMREGSAIHSRISPKVISSAQAMQKVWRLAQLENDKLRQTILCQYVSVMIRTARQMLVYDAKRYASDIQRNQKIIRSSWMEFLKASHISFSLIRAIAFLSLPFPICCRLRCLIKKDSD